MKKFNVIGKNECGEEFYVDSIKVAEMEDFSAEELAYMVLEKRKCSYRESYNEEINIDRFYIEPDYSTLSYWELQDLSDSHEWDNYHLY